MRPLRSECFPLSPAKDLIGYRNISFTVPTESLPCPSLLSFRIFKLIIGKKKPVREWIYRRKICTKIPYDEGNNASLWNDSKLCERPFEISSIDRGSSACDSLRTQKTLIGQNEAIRDSNEFSTPYWTKNHAKPWMKV
jgi:hypothetical protein